MKSFYTGFSCANSSSENVRNAACPRGAQAHRAIICLIAAAMLMYLGGCAVSRDMDLPAIAFASYKEIPGITQQEIDEVEALRQGRASFIYGMEPSSEAFYLEDGSIGGFAALLSDWLSGLFDIPFELALYDWDDLLDGLESHAIDFSGDLTPTPERMNIYHMTNPIAARAVKAMRLTDGQSPAEISLYRPLRYIFIDEAVTYDQVAPFLEEPFEISFVNTHEEVYLALKSGKADVFFEESPYEAAFDVYGDIIAEEFFPLVYSSVSLTTRNPELAPVIYIVQRALDNGAARHLTELYNQGHQQYLKRKFFINLTHEEQAFINMHSESGKSIPIGVEYDNYPISFYNAQERAWQGIAPAVLSEIEKFTGLSFAVVHEGLAEFPDLMVMLESGEIALLSEVIPTPERQGRFLWPEPYATDHYALITHIDFKDIELNEILYLTVGLVKDTAFTEVFWEWFPNHPNTVEFGDTLSAFEGLELREIDAFMGSRKLLLSATNYLEKPWYKSNIVFNRTYDSAFGVNVNEPELSSIINKAQRLIDTKTINDRWTTRVFDYRSAAERARTPYLVGASVLLFCVASLLVIMFARGKRTNALLEAAVVERTQELEKQMELAVSASKSKSDFLATMSHEIRTPMNAIIGVTQIQLHGGGLPEKCVDAFELIYNSGNTLMGIINDILDMSKIETGHLELNPSEYDMPSLLNDAARLNVVRIGSKPIEFILDIDERLPARLYGDELRLKQILNNLLSNAIKYTEEGYVKLRVSHRANGDETALEIAVEDTGQGMRPEDRDRLFSEYRRFNTGADRTAEGTGLGLNITKRLVEMMGGTINVESEYGKGSIFTATIMQNTVDCPPVGPEIAQRLHSFNFTDTKQDVNMDLPRSLMPYGRVLVVDDVETNLFVSEGLLAPYQLKVDTAISGQAAIEKIESGNSYDIVFMDHMMPLMDGIEAAKRLRELGYDGTIVALTANALVGNDEMFRENGFDGFISKPIDVRQLDIVLNNFIRDKHPEDAAKYNTRTASAQAQQQGGAAMRDAAGGLMIDGVDTGIGMAMSGGSVEKYRRTLGIFSRECNKKTEQIRACLETSDLPLYTTYVHALKSACANIGASALSEMAAALETAGNQEDLEFIQGNNAALMSSLEALVANISGALEATAGQAGESEAADMASLKAGLAELGEAIDSLNPRSIKTAAKNLQPFVQAVDAGHDIERILQHTLVGEYDEALLIMKTILQEE